MGGAWLAEVKQPQSPAILEDGDQHAEGGGGGEQVHHRGDRWYQQTAEGQHEQQESQDEDELR
jgi:hypothetical protein